VTYYSDSNLINFGLKITNKIV